MIPKGCKHERNFVYEMNRKRQMTGDLFQILPNSMHPFLVALTILSSSAKTKILKL